MDTLPSSARETDTNGSRAMSWVGTGFRALSYQLVLVAMFVAEVAVLTLVIIIVSLVPLGIGILLVPTGVSALRGMAGAKRRLVADWSGVEVEDPYRPALPPEPGVTGVAREAWWLLTDPATWRDLIWLVLDLGVGLVLALFPPALFGYGLWGIALPWLWDTVISNWGGSWYLFVQLRGGSTLTVSAVLGAVLVPLALALAPKVLDLHGSYVQWALGPTERTRLAGQVQHLSRSRWETLDSSAAELRRIERDLHDGAQSRLVAMGMTLSAAQTLLQSNPHAAEALLVEAKDASARALAELRDLVRGIHPPVLADRGLCDAVRALATDCPLPVGVTASVRGRFTPAVESAAYFAVSELLSNVAKHSGATYLNVDLSSREGQLLIRVFDNGRGGADSSRGTGLQGIERRLSAFDGTLSVHSPAGGPTTVDIALPLNPQSPATRARSGR